MAIGLNISPAFGGVWKEKIDEATLVGSAQFDVSYPVFLSDPISSTNPLSVNIGGGISGYGGHGPIASVDGRFRIGFGDTRYFELFSSVGYSYGVLPNIDPPGSGFVAGVGIHINPFSSFFRYIWLTIGYDARMYGSEDYTPEQMLWGGLTIRLIEVGGHWGGPSSLDAWSSQTTSPPGETVYQHTHWSSEPAGDQNQTNSSN